MTELRNWICILGWCAVLAAATSRTAHAVDVSPPAFLQWFESRYDTIENRIPDLWAAGYGRIWLPPPGQAESGDFSVGYDVYDRFDLGSAGDPTLYGTEAGLKRVSRVLHRAGGDLYVDFVINHNGFADLGTNGFQQSGGYPGFLLTHPNAIDGDFHSAFASGTIEGRLAGLIDIDHGTNFQRVRSPVPGFANNLPAGTTPFNGRLANVPDEDNRRYYPDRQMPAISVFDPTTGESNIQIYPFNTTTPHAGDPVTENAMGYLMRYAQWMVQEVGVDGFRIDAAKHVERFALNYFDRAVYRASTRNHLDGSRRDVFSFSEVFDGNRDELDLYIRKDINPADIGRVGGNRDVLDFAQFFAMRAELSSNGAQNDWRDMIRAGMDYHDDGRHNGSQGVMFVQSHDDGGPDLNNVAHAYMLMHPGNAVVYFNAEEFGTNRDFPRDGRGDALGGIHGDKLQRLVEIRNSHGRGDFRERWLEKEIYVYERSKSALVVLSNRGDNHYSQQTVDVDFRRGKYLVELTGNADNDASIPKLLQVFADCETCQPKVNITVKPNNGGDRGYLVYGPATPQAPAGIRLTDAMGNAVVDRVLSDPDPTSSTNGVRRLTDLHVIKADSFQARLTTVPVNLLGLIRDPEADGDNALIRLDGGRDLNGNGQVDFRTPGSVTYGFESFTTKHSDLWGGGDGEFRQTISTVGLGEGVHFLEVIAFRHREDGGPTVYSSFKKAIYVDRLPPESVLVSFDPVQAGVNETRRATIRSLDFT
ncbi:MAG: alpha-amylase family glycosyl hydrolase, partial [Pirellulales bacterium]